MVHRNWKIMGARRRGAPETSGPAASRPDPWAHALSEMTAARDGERRQRRQIAESGARQLTRALAVLREAEDQRRDAEATLRRARRMAAVGWMAAEACRDMTALHAVAARALTAARERVGGDHRLAGEIDWALDGLKQAEQMLERVTAYLDAHRQNTAQDPQAARVDGLLSGA